MISVILRSGNYPVIPPSGPSAAAPLVRCGAGMFNPGPVRTQNSSKNKSTTGVWVRAWFWKHVPENPVHALRGAQFATSSGARPHPLLN
jgi:hypothetical protein